MTSLPRKSHCSEWLCFLKRNQGAVAVEFALLFPVFVAIMIGGLELGRYMFLQNELSSAVQEAGRFAMVRSNSSAEPASEASILSFASQRLNFNDPSDVTFTIVFSPDNSVGSTLTIDATADFEPIIGLIDLSILSLNAQSTTVIVN